MNLMRPFEASKLKLDRAAKHLRDLEEAVAAYLAERPCVIVVEPLSYEKWGTRAWKARIRKAVPLDLSAIVGDVVHNLRTALDLLACDLVRLKGKSTRKAYFPFCDTEADLSATIKARHMNHAGRDIVQAIQALQPYKGGNITLRAVHDLDIADKHHAIIPVIGAVTVPVGDILKFPPTHQLQNLSTLVVQDGQMIVGIPDIPGAPQLGTEIRANVFLAFTDLPGLGNREIFETLHALSMAANDAFDALASLRPGAVFPSPPS